MAQGTQGHHLQEVGTELDCKATCSVVRVERDLAAIISLIEEMESLEPAGHPTPSRDRLTE